MFTFIDQQTCSVSTVLGITATFKTCNVPLLKTVVLSMFQLVGWAIGMMVEYGESQDWRV